MTWAISGTQVADFAGDIPTGYVAQYARNFQPLAQQAVQKIAGFFSPGKIDGEEAYEDYMKPFESDTGLTDAAAGTHNPDTASTGMGFIEQTARWTQTQWQYPEEYRRRVTTQEWTLTLPIEPMDKYRTLIDPTSEMLLNARKSFNRKVDNICLTALGATVSQGNKNAGTRTWTDTAFPTAQQIHKSIPFAVSFLGEFNELFQYNEEDTDLEMPICLLEEKGWSQMFQDDKFIHGDYNPAQPLGMYQMRQYEGIMFARVSSKRLTVASNIVTSYCWLPSAMKLSTEKDLTIEAGKRTDMNHVDQMFHKFSLGAFRLRDTGVIEFKYSRV